MYAFVVSNAKVSGKVDQDMRRSLCPGRWKWLFGFILFIWTIIYYKINTSETISTLFESKTTNINRHGNSRFEEDWCRMKRCQRDWERILKPCKNNLTWVERIPSENAMATDPDQSYITLWDINDPGQFSHVAIQTVTLKGKLKHFGGDAWRVHMTGPSAIAPVVIDHTNGTYEITFLAMEAGKYWVEMMLDYTTCDGLRDPPPDWFKRGNSQGKDQPQGILGKDKPYLLQRLWGESPVEITIKRQIKNQGRIDNEVSLIESTSHKASCCLCSELWNGLGRWVNNSWTPFLTGGAEQKSHRNQTGLLWIYGDSVAASFYKTIKTKPICTKIFKRCGYSYNWVYQMENYNLTLQRFVKKNLTIAKKENDDLDFQVEKVISEIKQVLYHPEMDKDGVIILNCGLHFVENTNFSNYIILIDKLIRLVKEETRDANGKMVKRFQGRFVWKTITAINREKYSMKHLHSRRFLTPQRVQLYNAYAMDAMCKGGIEVLDVYPLTDSYPGGTGSAVSPFDPVHYQTFVFESVEKLLESTFS